MTRAIPVSSLDSVTVTVSHLYDVTQLIQLVEAIRPICGRRGRPRFG
jgi:hypothetical protein